MYNGVKQGGVISCHLLNLYIDPLLVQLSNSGCRCHIAGVYAGALSYADDITPLCPSVWGSNEMMKICNQYRLENNIIFIYCIYCRANKSYCIGSVNKLKINYGKMTHNLLINIFKSYCCSFYSSHLGNLIHRAVIKSVNLGT